jgi:hypothetical protein
MTSLDDIPALTLEILNREVQGKSISWVGRPNHVRAMWRGVAIGAVGVPWTLFSIVWTAGASGFLLTDSTSAPQLILAVFGIPFVLIGLAMLSAPFFAFWSARRTVYVIADELLLTICQKWRGEIEVKSLPLADVLEVNRSERRDGSGSLNLLLGCYTDSDGDRIRREISMRAIPDVRTVEQIILTIRDRHRGRVD